MKKLRGFYSLNLTPLALITGLILSGSASAENIGSQSGNDIKMNEGDVLTGDALYMGGRYGILNLYPGTGVIELGNQSVVNVTDEAHFARGILIWGNNSTLNANGLTLNVHGYHARGIDLAGNKITANLGSGTSINVSGTGGVTAEGVAVYSGSSLTANALSIHTAGAYGNGLSINNHGTYVDLGNNSTITTQDEQSTGILMNALNGPDSPDPTTLRASQLTVLTRGDYSTGLSMQADTWAFLGEGSQITTSGNTANGIMSMGNLRADSLTIATSGKNSIALEMRDEGIADIGADSHISAAQAGGMVASEQATINFKGTTDKRNSLSSDGPYAASAQTSTSWINLDETDITSANVGLWALLGGHITGNNLSISGSADGMAVFAQANGAINLTGDLAITLPTATDYALATRYNAGYKPGQITVNARVNMKGSVLANGGQIDLSLQPDSVWEGTALSDNINGGYLNTTLDKSTWFVSGNSNLDLFTLNRSSVDFSRAMSAQDFTTLTVADLKGNGHFTMRVELVDKGRDNNNRGDKLVVTNSSAGDYTLSFLNQGSMVTNGDGELTVVETPDGVANFTSDSAVELGGYLYSLRRSGNDWILASAGTAPEPEPEPVPAPTPEPAPDTSKPDKAITTTADAGGNFLHIGYLLNYVETQTLLQRMGDIRQSRASGNVWLRALDGKLSAFSSGRLSHFDMPYSGFQFGVDKNLVEDKNVFAGAFMGVTHATPHYRGGDGTTGSQHVGGYLTWVADNGFYVDQVVKVNRLSNQFTVRDSQRNRVSAQAKSTGWSASIEAGKRFNFAADNQGFYLEPQAQFTLGHQKGSQARADNGLTVSYKAYNSALGRIGGVAGFSRKSQDLDYTLYLKTGVVREFSARMQYALNGSKEQSDFGGNGWNNGLGISANLHNRHNFYLEADLTTGQRFDQRQINAGYRYSF